MEIQLLPIKLICMLLLIGSVTGKPNEGRRLSCKEQAQKAINSNLIGAFIPKCLSDGHFAPLQCYGSIGVCFCVNKNGEKVSDAMIPRTKCSNPCFKRLLGNQPPAILVHGAPETIDMGIPAPDCDENGFFKPRQCDSSSCWCVDKSGNEFEHTRGNANDIVCE